MPFFYIRQSKKSGSYYTGTTADLIDRLRRHNEDKSISTRAECPWRLVRTEEFPTRGQAMTREHEIRSWKRHRLIEELC